MPEIRTLLVANRGEIARRIQRTARAMGLRTAAIYSDVDRDAPFVREADIAVSLAGRTPAQTYLDIGRVLKAAELCGADAIHPGYGFLSENAAFARAVVAAGLTWVGPPPAAIEAMGDKLRSKRLMQTAGVPTLPACEVGPEGDVSAAAAGIGYPLLVKASAGGGGKGMRIVEAPEDLEDAVTGARREAGSAFGDDTIFLERYVPASRHIEIQVLADGSGDCVHVFERECSIQRRHQKVIEEAPSPALTPELRARMGEAAVAAAKAVGYCSAGTVEFLFDRGEFWFLEMNTRLQVEHPVTEAISGLDLVREQLRIAQGEAFGFQQSDLSIRGHAIEVRLYAEDPSANFLPATGSIQMWRPSALPGVRFDAGIEEGDEVTVDFDPMLAKVIAHADTRREAALRLARALEETRLHGVTNNRDFLVSALRERAFLEGDTTTDFIERVAPSPTRRLSTLERRLAATCVLLARRDVHRRQARVLASLPSGWRNTPLPPERVELLVENEAVPIAYQSRRDGVLAWDFNGVRGEARLLSWSGDFLEAESEGVRVSALVRQVGQTWLFSAFGGDYCISEAPRFPPRQAVAVSGGLSAPMPGAVIELKVAEGDMVKLGQVLMLLEAMKMEHRIVAPAAGRVTQLRVQAGDQVERGALLAVVEEAVEPVDAN